MQLPYDCPKTLCAESTRVFTNTACQTTIPSKPQLNHHLSSTCSNWTEIQMWSIMFILNCKINARKTKTPPVGMHSQKRSALHRAGSDSHVTVTPFGKMREKKKQNSKFHYNTENSYIRQTTDVEAFFSLFSESHSETKGMMHSNKGGNKKEKIKKEEHQRGHLEISNTA